MNTPIYDFVQAYKQSNISRFHMPGHKGTAYLGCEAYDITEIQGADVLYSPDGIIAQSEANASSLFGTAHTFYSTEGSSLAIRAMLALIKQESNCQAPVILAARNAHKAFLYACALLDLGIEWLAPGGFEHLCTTIITPRLLSQKLNSMEKKPAAVYVTSPDYLGNISDIAGLSSVCKQFEIPLLVDNAHGAYLRFLEPSIHPISLGATACCDSAHKTLPVLTGGAYLHISPEAPATYVEHARKYLSLFASTSPSYLILQSLDVCNAYIAKDYKKQLAVALQLVRDAKDYIRQTGFCVLDGEVMKITVHASGSGYLGTELAGMLREHQIECEFADPDYVVLMVSAQNTVSDFERLKKAFSSIKPRSPVEAVAMPSLKTQTVLSPREAILSPSETVLVDHAIGRICASPNVSCPPAVPVVMSGEQITEQHISVMKYYGYESIDVVR